MDPAAALPPPPLPPMETVTGIPVAPGAVIARAFVLEQPRQRIPTHHVGSEDRDEEMRQLEAALESTQTSLEGERDRVEEILGPEPAQIFAFHLRLLQDESLIAPVRKRIAEESLTAASAVADAFATLADRFKEMGTDVFREKARDIIDLERRILGHLMGRSRDRLAKLTKPVVVIAHELTPAQAASLTHDHVVAVATDLHGRTDHTSIVLAALGVPVVVACHDVTARVDHGDEIIVDGRIGVVTLSPDEETVTTYTALIKELEEHRPSLAELAEVEAVTIDGVRIELHGNIEFPDEIPGLIRHGGDGVGLFRTEFLFLTQRQAPTEEEQYVQYCRALDLLEGRELTLRTLDLGADKYTQEQAEEPERNPFLGLRSIRYCLQNPVLFRTQLRAILRASMHGPLRIMFPLITTMAELRQAKMIVGDVREELVEEGIEVASDIPLGMMVEVPSAALMAPTFSREADFFSIGTNDLIQYTVAVDRGNERVANLYTASNPAVIKLIKETIRAARRGKIPVGLCGEIAGDPTYTMLLIGLGLRSLSLVPAQIPQIKQVIRRVDIGACEHLARRVGSFDSDRRILRLLLEETRKILPEIGGGWTTS